MTTPTTTLLPIFAAPFASVPLAEATELNSALISLFCLRATPAHLEVAERNALHRVDHGKLGLRLAMKRSRSGLIVRSSVETA